LTYNIHRGAADDLQAAVRFYRAEGGLALARRMLDEFERVMNIIQAHPEIGTPSGTDRRVFPLSSLPYSVLYRPEGNSVRVLVVRHQRRDPEFGDERR